MTSIAATVVVAALSSASINAGASHPPEQGTGTPAQPASSQAEAEEIGRRVKKGQKVQITEDQGREWRGRIATLAPDTLTLLMPDRRQMDFG
jgi:TolA-binding protein